MNKLIAFLFTLSLGNSISQVTFHAAFGYNYKLSFNRLDDSTFEPLVYQEFPDFSYYQTTETFEEPWRMQGSVGLRYKRHRLDLGVLSDGVVNKYRIGVEIYDPILEKFRADMIAGRSRTSQKRFYLEYDFSILNREKKTSLFVSASVGLCARGGPKEIAPVGTLGSSGYLTPNKIIEVTAASYTAYDRNAFNVGGGIGTDLYFKGYYFFTLAANFFYSPKHLYFDVNTVTIAEPNSVKTYEFKSYFLCTGLYFGISRRFQLYPWKPMKEKFRNITGIGAEDE
jgi:hypothetical protein